jgi:N-glycosylase/DNA lyase
MVNQIKTNKNGIKELKSIYVRIQNDIQRRLDGFKQIWQSGTEFDIYSELAFCIMTPQSKAKSCWSTVEKLVDNELLLDGGEEQLANELNCVRFRNTKAKNLIKTRELFLINDQISIRSRLQEFNNAFDTREWLVQNVRGMGYKEASHFLRNIGLGENMAILDRHILRNLSKFGVIDTIPTSLSRKKYLEIEKKMAKFANKIRIPLENLDLLLWYKETGEIFK